MGFIVNKPTEFSVQEIFEQLNLDAADGLDPDITVMTGGPVEPQRGFLLSNHPITDDVVEVLDGLFLASSPDVLPLAIDALNQGDAIFIWDIQVGLKANWNRRWPQIHGSTCLGMLM